MLGAQQTDDLVLDLGGVLGFVYAQVGVSILKFCKDVRVALQDGQGVAHLVIKVHALLPLQLPQYRRYSWGILLTENSWASSSSSGASCF